MARYVCSDLHGRYDLAKQIIDYLGPNDHLYFLGDAIDRGPYGLDTLMLLINHPQVTFFKGNHEDMMFKTLVGGSCDHVMIDHYEYLRREVINIWLQNGGGNTILDLDDLRERDPEEFTSLMTRVSDLRCRMVLTNKRGETVVLSHAGFQPGHISPAQDQELWDRDHIEWPSWPDEPALVNTIIVHGHTPIQYIREYQDEFDPSPYWYCDNHKVCIDLMSAYSGYAMMVNIDTWESIAFEGEHRYDI